MNVHSLSNEALTYDTAGLEVQCSPEVALSPSIGSGFGCSANCQNANTALKTQIA